MDYPIPKPSGNRFIYFGDESVLAICKGREPWFLAQDLGRLLEIKNIRDRMKEIPAEEKRFCHATISIGNFKERKKRMSVVNEAGLYRLIMMSRTETAEKFKTWVVREVLPTIRRTGKYEHKKESVLIEAKGANSFRAAVKNKVRLLEWIDEAKEAEQSIAQIAS